MSGDMILSKRYLPLILHIIAFSTTPKLFNETQKVAEVANENNPAVVKQPEMGRGPRTEASNEILRSIGRNTAGGTGTKVLPCLHHIILLFLVRMISRLSLLLSQEI